MLATKIEIMSLSKQKRKWIQHYHFQRLIEIEKEHCRAAAYAFMTGNDFRYV